MLDITIRRENEHDAASITRVTVAAFEGQPYSGNTEQYIVRALRDAGALALSLVAECDGEIVGHIAFSRVVMSDGSSDWYGVGPLSVAPHCQRQGVGTALMNEGLRVLRKAGAHGFVLVGDPGYYRRFGFENPADLVLEGVPPEVLHVLCVGGAVPRGTVVFHDAFGATS